MTLQLRPAESCRFDAVSLGEVMLRLDPGEGRIRSPREFRVRKGGGEYNVTRGLRRCFGMRTAVVTALADKEIGRLIGDLMLQGGVDTWLIRWVPFTERGFGLRGVLGVSDRGHTAARRRRLGPRLRHPRRTLIPHRGHLCRPL